MPRFAGAVPNFAQPEWTPEMGRNLTEILGRLASANAQLQTEDTTIDTVLQNQAFGPRQEARPTPEDSQVVLGSRTFAESPQNTPAQFGDSNVIEGTRVFVAARPVNIPGPDDVQAILASRIFGR